MSSLRFERVTVRYGRHEAVRSVDLEVPSGSVTGLVGESGSGKSTLARAAVGLVRLGSGRVLLDGVPLSGGRLPGTRRRPVQLVFQDPSSSLDPLRTAGQSVAEAISRDAAPNWDRRRAEVARLLALVALDPGVSGAYPAELSGGQRQRVAIARALASQPRVLIADEITSALDAATQATVLNLLRDLHRTLGLTTLFISHNLAVVRYVSDRVAVLKDGRVAEAGSADLVLGSPAHPYTQSLLAAVRLLGRDGRQPAGPPGQGSRAQGQGSGPQGQGSGPQGQEAAGQAGQAAGGEGPARARGLADQADDRPADRR